MTYPAIKNRSDKPVLRWCYRRSRWRLTRTSPFIDIAVLRNGAIRYQRIRI